MASAAAAAAVFVQLWNLFILYVSCKEKARLVNFWQGLSWVAKVLDMSSPCGKNTAALRCRHRSVSVLRSKKLVTFVLAYVRTNNYEIGYTNISREAGESHKVDL